MERALGWTGAQRCRSGGDDQATRRKAARGVAVVVVRLAAPASCFKWRLTTHFRKGGRKGRIKEVSGSPVGERAPVGKRNTGAARFRHHTGRPPPGCCTSLCELHGGGGATSLPAAVTNEYAMCCRRRRPRFPRPSTVWDASKWQGGQQAVQAVTLPQGVQGTCHGIYRTPHSAGCCCSSSCCCRSPAGWCPVCRACHAGDMCCCRHSTPGNCLLQRRLCQPLFHCCYYTAFGSACCARSQLLRGRTCGAGQGSDGAERGGGKALRRALSSRWQAALDCAPQAASSSNSGIASHSSECD